VEAALRSLLKEQGTSATGHALIREARQQQLITFDQANALAAFHAIRERLDFPEYIVTDADVATVRTAFETFAAGLQTEVSGDVAAPPLSPPAPLDTAVLDKPAPPGTSTFGSRVRGRPRARPWMVAAAGVLIVLIVWATVGLHRADPMLERGIDDYAHGRHDVAASEFQKAAEANPKSARPHVYLARIDRETGNFTTANEELQTALRLEPNDGAARREMASLLLAQGNYDLARTFYIHALESDPSDLAAQGWLGCTLVHLGRTDEGIRFFDRAGQGPWSTCRPPAAPPPAVAPPRPE
jgi:Tfp pilus assembly protein PilF